MTLQCIKIIGGSFKMKRKAFTVSVIVNIVLVGILGFGAYYKRDQIVYYVNKYITPPNKLEKDTAVFNTEPYETEIQYINTDKYPKALRIAVLGNSLSFHGINELWDHESGMAASSVEKDYVHILLKKLSETKGYGIEYMIINISEFERGFKNYEYSRLEKVKVFKPEIVIYQIGENVTSEDIRERGELFLEKYIGLVKYMEAEKEIICIPFWPNKDKIRIITEVALRAEGYLVDLSHLGNGIEPLNMAKSEKRYKHAGVAAHPGDYGMENIAKTIYITINKMIE
jgi:hypothetical protein